MTSPSLSPTPGPQRAKAKLAFHLDSFSGALTDLKPRHRTEANALEVLAKHPRVSCWDMETLWVRSLLSDLKRSGFIVEDKAEPYPWLKFNLTDAGRAALSRAVGGKRE